MKWVPTCSVANDLSWVEERSAVTLVNFIPSTPHEADHIAELGMYHLVGWLDDSSSEEEGDDDGQEEEGDDNGQAEEGDYGNGQADGEGCDLEEEDPANLEEQGETGLEADPWRQSWEWGSIMGNEQPLTFDNLRSDSNATVGGCSPVRSTLQELGSSQDAVEVHAWDSEVEALLSVNL